MDELETSLRRVHAGRMKSEAEAAEQRYLADSRARLWRILRKKLTTAFIGPLATFEKHFGSLWGHGKRESECTEQELRWRALWELCRTEALNGGNNQVRAAESEVGQYTVRWDRYVTNLPAAGDPPGVSSSSGSPQEHEEG